MTPDFESARSSMNVLTYEVRSMMGDQVEIWEWKSGTAHLPDGMYDRLPPDKERFCCWMRADEALPLTERRDGDLSVALIDRTRMIARYLEAKQLGLVP